MTDLAAPPQSPDDIGEKGLKGGALGLISSVVVGVASTAPAYSLAATLGFVVIAINGLQAPIITILAFVPMLFVSYGYKEMNYADPDCGTTFTWGARAFGPKTGWLGGWGIIAADLLVMASLAQIAGQYVFLLFNAKGIGSNPSSGWVLLVGVIWIVLMTAICYVGIEISANFQKALLGIELTMLLVLSIVALVKVGNGTAPVGHLTPSLSWFNPFHNFTFSGFMVGFTLMLFIYWGWDTAVSVNEETKDSQTTPGRAAVLSTLVLLATYALVILATQSYAGIGTKGIGLENPNNTGDVLSVLGTSIFGTSGFANVLSHLLLLMVLSSAAASTQTTILPTARTTLSMAVYKAIPSVFARIHKKYLTPTVSTLAMGGVSIILYVAMNYLTSGGVGHRRLGVGPRRDDRLLLRPDRIHLRLVLPGHSHRERTEPVGPGHHPPPRWPDPVVLHGLVLLVLLERGEQLHHLYDPRHAPDHRRRLHPRCGRAAARHHLDVRLQGVPAGLLPGRGPQPRHAHPGARGHRHSRRAVRHRALRG